MKSQALLLALSAPIAAAFAPPMTFRPSTKISVVDPSSLHEIPQHIDSLQNFFSSLTLADLDTAGLPIVPGAPIIPLDAAPGAVEAVVDPAAVDAAAAASANGWFGFLAMPIEQLLQGIHGGLVSAGLTSNAWGISIILMTTCIKALTFPLTKAQLESTNKMQSLQPTIKAIQAKYQSNPEVMNQKIAEIYQQNEVNPLAGCIPSIVQIPVFIGLYRSVLNLAKENALDEPFLFLPNLEGPTYGADPAHGSDWILKNWVDGIPTLGWHDSIAFLSIPIFLTASQIVSMNLMQPKTEPGAEPNQANAILKVLPFMIGWFALNVPAALGIYWVVNNLVTTGTTLFIRNSMPTVEAVGGGGAAMDSSSVMEATTTDFNPTPMNEKAVGFGGGDDSGMNTITPVDAEILSDDDLGPPNLPAPVGKGKRGSKKKKRRKN